MCSKMMRSGDYAITPLLFSHLTWNMTCKIIDLIGLTTQVLCLLIIIMIINMTNQPLEQTFIALTLGDSMVK